MLYDVLQPVLSDSTPNPPCSTGRSRVRVDDVLDDGVVVRCGDRFAVVQAWPDETAARRAARLATRLVAVDLFDLDGTPYAELTAVWHRVPHTRSVSMGAAMAFVLAGVPGFAEVAVANAGERPQP
jgi:hypothetical protein